MKVSQLARAAGVTAETVRHYAREGLLHAERDPDNGYREFGPGSVARLHSLRRARALGFSIAEIRMIIEDAQGGDSPCPRVRAYAAERLRDLDTRIETLQRQRMHLAQMLDHWAQRPDGLPEDDALCPLIDASSAEDAAASGRGEPPVTGGDHGP